MNINILSSSGIYPQYNELNQIDKKWNGKNNKHAY